MLRYPYRECWVDVYRSDELRAEVPFCDIPQKNGGTETATAQFSHASFFGKTTGCKDSAKAPSTTLSSSSSLVSCSADMTVTNWDIDASGAFYSDFDHATSIIGTCCTNAEHADTKTTINQALTTAGVYDQTKGTYKEAIPDPDAAGNAYDEYSCDGKYMFTHAEREAAFGSDREVGHNYYSDVESNTFGGFNSFDDSGKALDSDGYWYKNNDYASEFQSLSGAAQNTYAATTVASDSALQTKNEWSISSDIQGIYKVVASTDILGTTCTLRSGSTIKGTSASTLNPSV